MLITAKVAYNQAKNKGKEGYKHTYIRELRNVEIAINRASKKGKTFIKYDCLNDEVIEVLKKCNLYRELDYDWEKITDAAFHDKKADGDTVTVTMVNEPGSFELKTMKCLDVIELAKSCLGG